MSKADTSKIDLGHVDDLAIVGKAVANPVRRLEHARCNRAAGAALGNRLRGQRRAKRRGRPLAVPPPMPEPERVRTTAQGFPEPLAQIGVRTNAHPDPVIPGQGHGPEFEHDLNRIGAHLNPADYPAHWVVACEP